MSGGFRKETTRQQSGSRSISELDDIQLALQERPHVSIRARITAVFTILFLLMCAVTVSAVILLQRVRQKHIFFEKVSSFVFEIQQARRFEKNYFLYGTNLHDAIANVHVAREQFKKNKKDVQAVIGEKKLNAMFQSLETYQDKLEKLLDRHMEGTQKNKLESAIRKYGAQILDDAQDTMERERVTIHSMLQVSTIVALSFLGLMVVLLVVFGGFITQAVLRPLGRFMRYADRIGKGDFSPITPARKYRDEFSMLAIAMNQMLRELLRRHQQLIQSEKMAVVGNLTSGIAHELNNPLNNIGLSVESLLDGFEDYRPEQVRHILEQIATQVDRASGTVRNLLDFTRKEQQLLTSLDINEVIEATLKLVENELNLADIDLEKDLASGLPRVSGNPRGLEQVFLNLFLNAIQAMGEQGKLKVRSYRDGEWVKVDVSDTGPGIEEKHMKHLFDPFFTTKEPGKGTGLGLSVSQGIIDEHKGRITVSSIMGQGTTFTINLPLAAIQESLEKMP
ncbi:MAG: HAMP domain-containing protein [Deltaproteobacteria bacterium]|nr:HAMP domain-containing protein [Deltaproteobacteria bacterium]